MLLWAAGIGLTYAIGFGAWCVGRFQAVGDEIGKLRTDIAINAEKISSGTDQRYRKSDAERDFFNVHEAMQRLDKRVDRLEEKRPP